MMNYEHEQMRREVWVRAWVAAAGTETVKATSTATHWADSALEAFDERFASLPLAPYPLKVRRKS